MSSRSRNAVALGAFLLAGCSLLTNFDEFTSAGPPNAAEAGDAGSPPDGGGDAAAPVLDCGDATFCDDFERTTPVGSWDRLLIGGGGSLDTSTERPHSGTYSLRSTLPGLRGESAGMARSFPSVSRFKSTYFLSIGSTDGTRSFDIFQVRFSYAAGRTIAIGIIADTQLLVGEQQFLGDGGFVQNLLGTYRRVHDHWYRIDVDVDVAATVPNLTVTIDDTTVLDKRALSFQYGPADVEAVAGVLFTEQGGPTTVDVDDVRIEINP